MEVTTFSGDGRLPCGVALADLVEQVAEGTGPRATAHQRSCGPCRAAIADLDRWWGSVRQMAVEPTRPPRGLVRRIMERVRRTRARTPQVTVAKASRGVTTVALDVVASVAERATGRVPGVAAVLGWAARPLDDPAVAFRVGEHPSVAVDLEIAANLGWSLPDVATAVRSQVLRDVHALVGVDTVEIDVAIEDVIGGDTAMSSQSWVRRTRLSGLSGV